MMKTLLFLVVLFAANATRAQVGIGTNTPSANAVLDVSSTNKGILLPRVNDTTLVSSPSAGLMIYNRAANAPAFHNGTQWNTLATRTAATNAGTDSITYTITNAATEFVNGTYKLLGISNEIANSGGVAAFQVSISKLQDINSIGFTRSIASGSPTQGMVIEIKMFVPGAATPYYSIKLSNLQIINYKISISPENFGLMEQIAITPIIYGYKDWVNNKSFAWNTANRIIVTY